MMPLGFSAAISARRRVVAQDDRIDVALADAPRDDLRVLRPEIQNDDLLSHVMKEDCLPVRHAFGEQKEARNKKGGPFPIRTPHHG